MNCTRAIVRVRVFALFCDMRQACQAWVRVAVSRVGHIIDEFKIRIDYNIDVQLMYYIKQNYDSVLIIVPLPLSSKNFIK